MAERLVNVASPDATVKLPPDLRDWVAENDLVVIGDGSGRAGAIRAGRSSTCVAAAASNISELDDGLVDL